MIIREINGEPSFRHIVKDVCDYAIDELPKYDDKVGILLCEGDENSIDNYVYKYVFSNLLVIPVGGCSTVIRFVPQIRQRLDTYGIYTYGIIDRDALSKKEVKSLFRKTGVYTTKLPFIENIICCPEAIQIVCEAHELDFETVLVRVEAELLKILWQKLKEALPINLGIEKGERIRYLNIGAATKRKEINKQVDANSILYSYRDKVLVAIVGNAIGLKSRKQYYSEMMDLLSQEKYNVRLTNVFANYVPKFDFYEMF